MLSALPTAWILLTLALSATVAGAADPPAEHGKSKSAPAVQESAPSGPIRVPEVPEYRVGPGDVLQVSVWREPELSAPAVAVRYDGKISVPLVREVYAVGLTVPELEQELTTRYAEFVNTPVVTVIVREVRSQKIYMVGSIAGPGTVDYEPGLTVMRAIAKAGGVTDFAKRKKVTVVRGIGAAQHRMEVDYDAILKGKAPEQDYLLQPGDTIIVP